VGRYVVLERIGAGGMGVVYAAYDPELDRKVALKLLRPDRAGAAGEAALRLQREAQAIARLSDPHVVAVYDAGTFGDQVFVAMEFVEGRTLRQWLAAEKRGWREIVDVFGLAGRGLAAAHAAGLVHRDFKPDNVLLGTDGRIKVADFGLARPAGEVGNEGSGSSPGSGSGGLLASPLTKWGAVMGTPAYMAPEQLRGAAADARSDQFSFCVALWEALYGQKPFAGAGLREMLDAERRGEVREPPEGTGVPGRLQPVLRRGLSASPAARYPGMPELLHDLQHDPAVSRRRWLIAAVLILATAALFSSLGYFQARRAQLCGGGEEKLAGVWDEGRKATVRTAFLRSGSPFARETWGRIEPALDLFAADWSRMHRSACEATRVRGEQSEDLLDRRMVCLDQRLSELRALADLFSHADAQVVLRTDKEVSGLGQINLCADSAALTAKVPLPRDPAVRARVEAARSQVTAAKVLTDAGKPAEALGPAQEAAKAAQQAGYAPLEAAALYQVALLQDNLNNSREAERTMFDALTRAQTGGDFETAGLAAAQLSWIVGFQQARHEDGERWSQMARAIIDGARGGPALRFELLKTLGTIQYGEGKLPQAVETARQALVLGESAYGPESSQVAAVFSNLGVYYDVMGKSKESVEASLRGLAIRRKALPPGHPDFAKSYNTLANGYLGLNQQDLALSFYQQAAELFGRRYGATYPSTVGVRSNIAIILKDKGRYAEALRLYEEDLRVQEAAHGKEHPDVASVLDNIAEVYYLEKRYGEALEIYRQALAIDRKILGPSHFDLSYSLRGIGISLLGLGRPREALEPLEQALSLREKQKGQESASPEECQFYLAQALWDGGGDRQRAFRLARQAREGFAHAEKPQSVKKVDDWLSHPHFVP
jgi:tetratricopeptide (TPR) repeat protein/predicted Ser/Thr protein kinase